MNFSGRRIVIVGISASGKSTFARSLAERIHAPLTHMDAIWWKPGWVEAGEEEATKQLEIITSGPEWVIEGYIPKTARPFVFERADAIIYLDYSGFIPVQRYVRRWWKHRKDPRPELEGSPEKFSFKFLKLVWSKGEAISLNKYLKTVVDQEKILTFTHPKQADSFIQMLK